MTEATPFAGENWQFSWDAPVEGFPQDPQEAYGRISQHFFAPEDPCPDEENACREGLAVFRQNLLARCRKRLEAIQASARCIDDCRKQLEERPSVETAAALLTAAKFSKAHAQNSMDEFTAELKRLLVEVEKAFRDHQDRVVMPAREAAVEVLRNAFEAYLTDRFREGNKASTKVECKGNPDFPPIIASCYLRKTARVTDESKVPEDLKSPDMAKIKAYKEKHGVWPEGVSDELKFTAMAPASSGR